MGCDIHYVLEVKDTVKNRWVGIAVSYGSRAKASERWYLFFTELGLQTRGESESAPALTGFPQDASDTAEYHYNYWAGSAHSPSSLPLADFVAAYNRVAKQFPAQDELDAEELLNLYYTDDDKERRVVFWFDN